MAVTIHPSIRVHPGPWLKRTYVEPYKMTIADVAKHLDVTRANMSRLLNGKASLTPEMARRFEDAFGVKAATLLRIQADYDLGQLELSGKPTGVARIPEPV
ncbi:HigA family addiction module antitoxin [Alterisphingorhabdus coralli]|uniref:HigA family addiction module antitoxin n=1 Tax=Alterisphingorhabdus coralli TaxID=3071408 RepID=A0AA97I1B4_9SPHN|nr:HigA family addiction module antitoxin [Parasphingorhabdus sp. SCSIO 66989]WOE75120.1 HigA family addiction module antitoxin [Parasphingorhabdus sp. SCSIO 66989]